MNDCLFFKDGRCYNDCRTKRVLFWDRHLPCIVEDSPNKKKCKNYIKRYGTKIDKRKFMDEDGNVLFSKIMEVLNSPIKIERKGKNKK
jgi:hypothetical protein